MKATGTHQGCQKKQARIVCIPAVAWGSPARTPLQGPGVWPLGFFGLVTIAPTCFSHESLAPLTTGVLLGPVQPRGLVPVGEDDDSDGPGNGQVM